MADDDKKRIVTNPNEPNTGDFAFALWNKAHPVTGQPATIAYWKKQLRGLMGQTVRLRIRAGRIDQDTQDEKRFNMSSTFELDRYDDLFGPGSAYSRAVHTMKDRYSDDELVVYSFTIEAA